MCVYHSEPSNPQCIVAETTTTTPQQRKKVPTNSGKRRTTRVKKKCVMLENVITLGICQLWEITRKHIHTHTHMHREKGREWTTNIWQWRSPAAINRTLLHGRDLIFTQSIVGSRVSFSSLVAGFFLRLRLLHRMCLSNAMVVRVRI